MDQPASRNLPMSGWGGVGRVDQPAFRPERYSELWRMVQRAPTDSLICRGAGRSYGDQALNPEGGVLLMGRLNRFLGFDPDTGTLECEGGVLLADILRYLLPRGWFPWVTPGTKFVTVGGAVANDVHGKNHHGEGSFGHHVEEIDVLTAAGEVVRCSRQTDAELFWATLGGCGLTGVVLRARFRLRRVSTAYMRAAYRRAPDLGAALDLLSGTDSSTYSVCWVDGTARGRQAGRAVLMTAEHAPREALSPALGAAPLRWPARRVRGVPPLPVGVVGQATAQAFNDWYYRSAPSGERIVDGDSYFYPLDGLRNWPRLYGRTGFAQVQGVVPFAGAERVLERFLHLLHTRRVPCTLGVLKRMGEASGGLLSFPRPGVTMAFDLPAQRGIAEVVRALYGVVLDAGGRIYLAKDGFAEAGWMPDMYPGLPRFLATRARVDPRARWGSAQARRLGLMGA